MKVGFSDVVNNVRTLTFEFSNTERGATVSPQSVAGNFVIDLDGNIIENQTAQSSAVVTIIGGIDGHAYRKDNNQVADYYLNHRQRITVIKLIQYFATIHKFDGQINPGSNIQLNNVVLSLFRNFCS